MSWRTCGAGGPAGGSRSAAQGRCSSCAYLAGAASAAFWRCQRHPRWTPGRSPRAWPARWPSRASIRTPSTTCPQAVPASVAAARGRSFRTGVRRHLDCDHGHAAHLCAQPPRRATATPVPARKADRRAQSHHWNVGPAVSPLEPAGIRISASAFQRSDHISPTAPVSSAASPLRPRCRQRSSSV